MILEQHSVLRTADLDEARASVSARYCDHRLDLLASKALGVVHNHARGNHLSLNFLTYGADVAIDPGHLEHFYLLQIPLAGRAQIQHLAQEVQSDVNCASLLCPDRPTQMTWSGDCRQLMLQIDKDFLLHIAQSELGSELTEPVRFNPQVNLTSANGRQLRKLILWLAAAVDSGAVTLDRHPATNNALEQRLVSELLRLQPSNISSLLDFQPNHVSSLQLRRAVSFIREQHQENISLAQIARAAGINPRTLQLRFQADLGVTPIQFLRDIRLDRARSQLLNSAESALVSQVAYDCGYSHLGRFARDFRARFGQSPSEFIRRNRRY